MRISPRATRMTGRAGIMTDMTVDPGVTLRWRGWDLLLGIALGCWVVGFIWHLWRPPSLWLFDLVVVPLSMVVYWFGCVMVVVAGVGSRRWSVVAAVLPVILVLTVLVNPAWRVAPQAWFAVHRPLFELARTTTDPGRDLYGTKLPLPLRFLTADGRVSRPSVGESPYRGDPERRFFPQWIGIPDDAGGYLYSPDGSPEGTDLYGMNCTDPVDLGGDWWMCGL